MTSATPAPPPGATPAPVEATPEQLASVVRVRVTFGGLPPRDTVAALLHRDEIPDPSLVEGFCRFVLAPLKGWQEAQLRAPQARFIIYRNKADSSGTMAPVAFPARLMQFEAGTGLAVLAYIDDFAYAQDAGFRLKARDPINAPTLLLRTSRDTAEALPVPNRARGTLKPFSVDAGTHRTTGEGQQVSEMPPLDAGMTGDAVQLAVTAPDRLTQFVDTSTFPPVSTPVDGFTVAIKKPRLEVTNVDFETRSMQGRLGVSITAQGESGDSMLNQMRLLTREVSRSNSKDVGQPNASGAFPPISDTLIQLSQQSPGTWYGVIPEPPVDQEKFYLMQIACPLLRQDFGTQILWPPSAPAIYSQPFLVKMERGANGLSPTVDLLAAPAAAIGETATPPERFALETSAKDVHLIAGGREALIQLDGSPYWKRFSFEKKTWLPIPGDLSSALITGNLDTLFVLDRSSGEVRKFKLPALEPAGSTKLPSGEFQAILAGCNTARAPVHVILPRNESLALDPETLQRRDAPRRSDPSPPSDGRNTEKFSYSITGDGLSIRRGSKGADHGFVHYNSDARGLEYSYLGIRNQNSGRVPGVTAGFDAGDGVQYCDTPGGEMRNASRPSEPWTYAQSALSENCPVVFRILQPGRVPLMKRTRLGCFAFLSGAPFAEVDVPELNDTVKEEGWRFWRWVFLDPYSQRLATLSADRKTWFIRELVIDANREQPVLLNWPDTTVTRGGKFRFQPKLAAGTKFTAGLQGKPGVTSVDEAAGAVEFPVAANEFASLKLLDFKVPGKDGVELYYPMLVRVAGPELPFMIRPRGSVEGLNGLGRDLATLGSPNRDVQPLAATFLQFSDPILEVQGPVAGCAALITANRVDFLSLETRRIVGSTTIAEGAIFYIGAGALLEYDPGKRSLTRIRVPGGQREQSFSFPPNSSLRAIGAGADLGSPITVFVAVTKGERWLRFSDVTYTLSTFATSCAVLDGLTLRAGGRAQPASFSKLIGKGEENAVSYFGAVGALEKKPVRLPASRNGSMVTLPGSFLAMGPTYAVIYPFGHNAAVDLDSSTSGRSSGSLSGLMAFSSMGRAFKAGVKVGDASGRLGASPCGRYQFGQKEVGMNENCLAVRLAENGEPLLHVAGLAFMESGVAQGERVTMLGDEGPLAILSDARRTLELVDLNIPSGMNVLAPKDFHVVSQPVIYVMEGRATQYQVQTNNPEAVQSYRLQSAVPGAQLSAKGLLTYQAPATISEPTHVTISIEIIGVEGKTVLHEFPIYVLPWARPAKNVKLGR